MGNVFQDLYYGKLTAFERDPVRSAENKEVCQRIETEKRYFLEKMSLDDCQRFQAFEDLYLQADEFKQEDAFAYGFKLGLKLTCAAFMDENGFEHSGE